MALSAANSERSYELGLNSVHNNLNVWQNDSMLCGTEGSANDDINTGVGCAARIMENGWVMDY
jgi:hypothetical protein